jgi:hypothetical protein
MINKPGAPATGRAPLVDAAGDSRKKFMASKLLSASVIGYSRRWLEEANPKVLASCNR